MRQIPTWVIIGLLLLATSLGAVASSPSQERLQQLLAPVALYPDTLLSHLLIASAHPEQLGEAQDWSEDRAHPEGRVALEAAEGQAWNPSVKALVALPQLLDQMLADPAWARSLGEAFVADEARLLAQIQTLRHKALEAGNLRDNDHQLVTSQGDTLRIEVRNPEYLPLPYYDGRRAYGPWRWQQHPPVIWPQPRDSHWQAGAFWASEVELTGHFYATAIDWEAGRTQVLDREHLQPTSYYYSAEGIIQHPHSHAWNGGPANATEYQLAGSPSQSNSSPKPVPEGETYSGSNEEIHTSGAISRVYRGNRSYSTSGHSSYRGYGPDIGVSIHYRHRYPSYKHRSYRKHQYGHGLRHYRYPGYGSKLRHGGHRQYHGYRKPHRYGHGFRHGYRGSLHYRGGSSHRGFGGSVHIRK